MAYLYKVCAIIELMDVELTRGKSMSGLKNGSDIPGSVLLTWHEKVGSKQRHC